MSPSFACLVLAWTLPQAISTTPAVYREASRSCCDSGFQMAQTEEQCRSAVKELRASFPFWISEEVADAENPPPKCAVVITDTTTDPPLGYSVWNPNGEDCSKWRGGWRAACAAPCGHCTEHEKRDPTCTEGCGAGYVGWKNMERCNRNAGSCWPSKYPTKKRFVSSGGLHCFCKKMEATEFQGKTYSELQEIAMALAHGNTAKQQDLVDVIGQAKQALIAWIIGNRERRLQVMPTTTSQAAETLLDLTTANATLV